MPKQPSRAKAGAALLTHGVPVLEQPGRCTAAACYGMLYDTRNTPRPPLNCHQGPPLFDFRLPLGSPSCLPQIAAKDKVLSAKRSARDTAQQAARDDTELLLELSQAIGDMEGG